MRVEPHGIQRVAVFTATVVVLALTFMASSASGALLVDFLPQPASSDMAEFIWADSALSSGPGAFGTGFAYPSGGIDPGPGDGEDALNLQDVPGLQIVTPFVIDDATAPGGVTNAAAGSTTFYDVTLDITTPLTAVAGAPDTQFGLVVQGLNSGAFELWSTDPDDTALHDPTLLLAGTIEIAAIAGILNSDIGAVLSAKITYTGGVIYDAALDHHGSSTLTGSFSWSLLDVDAPLSITGGALDDFDANGTGQFSGIPEPATLILLLSGACMVTVRRRRRTT